MPLTFRDRDGRKVTRIPLEVHLTVHELVNATAYGDQAGLFALNVIDSDEALRDAVAEVLQYWLGAATITAESKSEAMVVVAKHVGREQALELLRGPRITPFEEAALNDPVIRDAIGEAKSGDRSGLVQRERPEGE